jgi:hypothetical protein
MLRCELSAQLRSASATSEMPLGDKKRVPSATAL